MTYHTQPDPSYIEVLFYNTWRLIYPPAEGPLALVREYQIAPYRVDFANIQTMTIVELDGLEHHSSAEDIAADRRRERFLEKQGWHVTRYGGKEIIQDALAVAEEVLDLLIRRYAQQTAVPIQQVQREVLKSCSVSLYAKLLERGVTFRITGPREIQADFPQKVHSKAAVRAMQLYTEGIYVLVATQEEHARTLADLKRVQEQYEQRETERRQQVETAIAAMTPEELDCYNDNEEIGREAMEELADEQDRVEQLEEFRREQKELAAEARRWRIVDQDAIFC